MTQAIHEHRFDNGLRLIAEPIAGVQSLAMTLKTPAGVATEPADQQGVAPMLSEMVHRGAGDLDARAHTDALDKLGVHRSTNVETHHFTLSATMLAANRAEAMPLLFDMIRRPHLADESLEPSRDLAIQAIDALDDEPQQRVFIELKRQHYPAPFGRSSYGQRDHLQSLTADQIREFWNRNLTPDRSILAFAGAFDFDQLVEQVGNLLGDWTGTNPEPDEAEAPERGYVHHTSETSQVHIGLAYDAVPEPDETSIYQRAAVALLSGGMSGRLFTEVREKRGLCYAVYAAYAGQRDRGAVLSYAGTTTARAQETLEVLTAEHRRLSDGIEQGEFDRAIVGMKSRVVMQGESTGARAAAIANDQYIYGRPRTLDELAARIDAVRREDVEAFVQQAKPQDMTIVTVGPEPLVAAV